MNPEKQLDWSDIYKEWRIHTLHSDWDGKVSLTPVMVSTPLAIRQIGSKICDWWPTAEIVTRRNAMEQFGIQGVTWQTNKGTFHTVELLHKCQDNPEAQAAILIAASVRDMLKSPPTAWRGNTYRLIESIWDVVMYGPQAPFSKFNLSVWYPTMRSAQPVNIVSEEFGEFCKPRNYQDFVYLAFLSASLSVSQWTPVIVSPVDQVSTEA